jgi:hypothetical protein
MVYTHRDRDYANLFRNLINTLNPAKRKNVDELGKKGYVLASHWQDVGANTPKGSG